jgi:type III secretion protein V
MFEAVSRFAGMLSRRGDLVIAMIVLTAVIMMIVPLPTTLVDILITINIATAVLILLVAFYIMTPTQFSTLPAVILIATLFRLAITITTTRLILLQADAGQVVGAFGDFVIGGNVAVGLVVFFIITIGQFVVITKGGERVAEVAARFSLDALPGKQMSIDNEMRNGDITQPEARALRRALERESHLYGAMDGAMKFVKGDAIAGLVIIVVNLVGGLAVGMGQQGLSFGQAVHIFSLLTVGDGLVAQIPALLISVAAGTVVTRVATEERRDLGSDIISQLVTDERALYLAGVIVAGLAFIPGFPTYVFLTLAATLLVGGFFVQRRGGAAKVQEVEIQPVLATRVNQAVQSVKGPGATGQRELKGGLPGQRVVVWVGPQLAAAVSQQAFSRQIQSVREALSGDLGVAIPEIELQVDASIGPHRFHIDLEDVPVAEGDIFADCVLVDGDTMHLDLANIPYEKTLPLLGRRDAVWVQTSRQGALNEAGIAFIPPTQTLGRCLDQMLRRFATHFIGIQETRALLASAEADYGDLVKEAQNVASIQKISEILRRLVEENVPIRNLRLILEALVEWAPREQDVVLLGEYVRMALGRQICFRVADRNRLIAAYVLERSVEDMLRSAVRPTTAGTFLNISEDAARPVIDQFRRLIAMTKPDVSPAVLAAMDVRRHLRNLLMRNDIDIPVLSYQELAPEFSVQPLATVVLDPRGTRDGVTSGHIEQRMAPQPAR